MARSDLGSLTRANFCLKLYKEDMKESKFMVKLKKKGSKAEALAENATKDSNLLVQVFDGVFSENPRIKFTSAKILRAISKKNPRKIYSKMHFFTKLLNSENNILKWIAIDVIGNLAVVDSKGKFDKIFKKFYDLLSDESMITAGHVIDMSGTIVKAKPHLCERIVNRLLSIEKAPFGEECRNILIGKAIIVFKSIFDDIKGKTKVVAFARRQLKNPRNATKVKAERFFKKLAIK